MGTRHYSAHRAGGGVVLAALGLTAAAAPLMGLDPWSLLNIETGFALFTASSLAGAGVEGRRFCNSPRLAAGYTCICNQGGSQPASGCRPLHPPTGHLRQLSAPCAWLLPAGLSARMLPVWMQQAAEERRLRASDAEFERVISMGVGPMDTGTEEQEVSSCRAHAGGGEACTMLGRPFAKAPVKPWLRLTIN